MMRFGERLQAKYRIHNRSKRPTCRVCGRPVSLYFNGWRHVGPWKNHDKHKADPRPYQEKEP